MLQCRCLWCPVQHVSDYYIHSPRIRVCELDAGRLHPGSSTAYGRESWIRPSLIGWLPNEKKWTLKWKKSQISRNSIGAGSFFLRTPPQLFMGKYSTLIRIRHKSNQSRHPESLNFAGLSARVPWRFASNIQAGSQELAVNHLRCSVSIVFHWGSNWKELKVAPQATGKNHSHPRHESHPPC